MGGVSFQSIAIKAQGDILILDEVLYRRRRGRPSNVSVNDYSMERAGKTNYPVTHDMSKFKNTVIAVFN